MGRITSSTGLFSGIPIQQTVDQLIALQARPRDLLLARNETIEQRQVGLTSIAASLLSLKLSLGSFNRVGLFDSRTATSSSPALSATVSGQPAVGAYSFSVLRVAQAQQWVSSGIASDTAALGGGSLALRFGGFVDPNTRLDLLNRGEGLARGRIRITDRTGATATIDLSHATTVNDVLSAVQSSGLQVRLEAVGDRFRLVDTSGATTANLRVDEVGGGSTAQSLGLAGINVAAATADGQDVVELFDNLKLSLLNDNLGVRFDGALADLRVSLRDGSQVDVDFLTPGNPGTKPSGVTTGLNGSSSQLTFTAVEAGAAYAGVTVAFHDDPTITEGNETVSYDAETKVLLFRIDEGRTTASQVAAALAGHDELRDLFTAQFSGDGLGKVNAADLATIDGPQATAQLVGASGAKVTFTAAFRGAAYDGVTIRFEDNPATLAGEETVEYDAVDKELVFQISSGNTTAADLVDALAQNEAASQYFTAQVTTGSSGTLVIDAADTAVTSGGAPIEPTPGGNEITLGQVIDTINAAAPDKLLARLAADGDRLELVDLSTDAGGTFQVENLNRSHVVDDLQLGGPSVGDTITGGRLLAGLNTVFLRSLDGGRGLADLGAIEITDRAGQSTTIDLSTAETLHDVLEAFDGLPIGVAARVNRSRTGLEVYDTTGATTTNLSIADADSTETATRLRIVGSAAADSLVGANLKLQVVNQATRLDSLNGGAGVARSTFKIRDKIGATATIDLAGGKFETLGDVIDEINRHGIEVEARLNDAGDGLLIYDTSDGGGGTLEITEGASTTARDLNLLGPVQVVDVGGEMVDAIDASSTRIVTLEADDTLADFVDRVNALGIPVSASYFATGSSVADFRISISSQRAGAQSELLLDASGLAFSFQQAVAAEDALLLVGAGNSTSGGILVSSADNSFVDVAPGLTITVSSASPDPITVEVKRTSDDAKAAIEAFVSGYNALRGKIDELTAVDPTTGAGQPLTGDSSLLRVDLDLGDVLSGRFRAAGSLGSLAEIGLSLDAQGELQFDAARFDEAYAADPAAVEDLFTSESTGVVDRLEQALENLADTDNAVLVSRLDTLTRTLELNQQKIDFLNERLSASRERLLREFQRMEEAIARMQTDLSALSAIQAIPPLGVGSLGA